MMKTVITMTHSFKRLLITVVTDDLVADGGRLSMDKDVHPRFACQLETRTWCITDDNDQIETVNGPGVVGLYLCLFVKKFSQCTADTVSK